jgi:cytochrome P450
LKLAAVRRELLEIIGAVIQEKRARGVAGDTDLLSRLIAATDDAGRGMDDQQLRDEALTVFLAGHETTALTLTYALAMLSRHPDEQAAVRAEAEEVWRGEASGLARFEAAKRARAVVNEALRLYPPAWGIGREAVEDVEIGGATYPKGIRVVACQWLVHRDARFYPQPHRFMPERWLTQRSTPLPRFAFFPFGGGPRVCIGNHFAMLEAVLALSRLALRFEFAPLDAEAIRLNPSVTLRPAGPVRLRVSPVG